MNLNKAMIIGNLTRDPESRSTADGTSVCSFSVATSMIWKDQSGNRQERVEYHNIVAWRRLAEICGQYLRKGSKVYVEGRLQTRSWDDQSGIKRYKTEIIADNLIMLDRAGSTAGAPRSTEQPAKTAEENIPTVEYSETSSSSSNTKSSDEINIEEIPF